MDSLQLFSENILKDIEGDTVSNMTYRQLELFKEILNISVIVSFKISKTDLVIHIEHKFIPSNNEHCGYNGNILLYSKRILFIDTEPVIDEIKKSVLKTKELIKNLKFNKISGEFYDNDEDVEIWNDVKYQNDIFGDIVQNETNLICIHCKELTLTKTIDNEYVCLQCWNKNKYKMIKQYPINPPNIIHNSDSENEDEYTDGEDYTDDEEYD
jgi:hypothetical protein